MKPLAIWLAIVAVVFGAYALVTTITRDTKQVFVFVDASNPMVPVWRDVPRELDRIDNADHTEFALATGQQLGSQLVHSWQGALKLSTLTPFAPCSFAGVDSFPEAAQADEKILVTTSGSCDTSKLTDWTIVELTP